MLPQIEASINRRMVNSAALFNDLVGALQQRLRHGEAQPLRSFRVDDQLEARRALYGQIGRARPLEDLVDVDGDPPHGLSGVRTIGEQQPVFRAFPPFNSPDVPIPCSELDNLATPLLQ